MSFVLVKDNWTLQTVKHSRTVSLQNSKRVNKWKSFIQVGQFPLFLLIINAFVLLLICWSAIQSFMLLATPKFNFERLNFLFLCCEASLSLWWVTRTNIINSSQQKVSGGSGLLRLYESGVWFFSRAVRWSYLMPLVQSQWALNLICGCRSSSVPSGRAVWVSHTETTPSVSPLSRYLPDLRGKNNGI